MINGGKVNLIGNDVNNLYYLNNYSHSKRNNSPITINEPSSYNYYNYNNSINKHFNNDNFNEKRNAQYPSYQSYFNNSNNYYLQSSQQYSNDNRNIKFIPNISENNEKEILIQKIKHLINENEKKKGQKIIKDYYTKNYEEMIKKNIDTYPNGINLSISNCETQYPINNLNDDDEFFRKLKFFLEEYENIDNKRNNKNINNLKSSYEYYSKILKKNESRKRNNYKVKFFNESVGDMNYTYRQDPNNNKPSFQEKYQKNISLNKSIKKFYKDYNKTSDNFHNSNKKEDTKFNNDKKIYDIYDKQYNTIRNIDDSNYLQNLNNNNDNNNRTKSRIKLMNIETKKKDNQKYKNVLQYINLKNKKNINKEYELQEKYITKIKLFIQYIENYYILSINEFFRYFIENLKLYGEKKIEKNKETKKILKRFQKSRNIKTNYNSISFSNNINNYNTINNSYNLNKNTLIQNYKYKDNPFITESKRGNNISPDIYIPKNKIEQIRLNNKSNLSNIKNKRNKDISPNISNNKNIDNINNLSTDYNSKKLFSTNEKNNLVKINNNIQKKNLNNNIEIEKININKNINSHIKNISSFDINSKSDSIDCINGNNLKEKNPSKKKPIVYLKPKSGISNLKKMIITKDKEICNNNKNDNINKSPNKKSLKNNNESLNNNSIQYNPNSINSLIIKNIKNNSICYKSPLKSNSPIKREQHKYIYKIKRSKDKIPKNKIENNKIEEFVVKSISTYDKRLWVTIKYIASEKANHIFFKMKIKRRLLNIKDNKNIFLDNQSHILKPSNNESIEIIPPLSLLKTQIENSNNKISIIPEEKEDNNNYLNKIIDIIKIIQKSEKENIVYYYKYFFDILKKEYNPKIITTLSQKEIFKNVQNSFIKINDIDFTKIPKNINEDNDNENNVNEEFNNSNNDNFTYTIKKNLLKKDPYKRNLFPDINIPRLNIEDNSSNGGEKNINNLNKSDIYERSELSDITGGERTLNFSDIFNIPKKNSFRLKITKYKILRERIDDKKKKKIKIKKDIIKEDEEMRKKSKIIYLITNKFSYYNNCLRLIKNYFNIWKIKKNSLKEDNIKENNTNNNIISNNINDDINKDKNNNMQYKDNENKVIKEKGLKDEDSENNSENIINSNDEGIIKINDLIENNKDIFNLTFNALNKINNRKGIQIESIQDSDENKTVNLFDKNELEEKIEYFRMYLMGSYAFKRKNIGSSEEEKEQ